MRVEKVIIGNSTRIYRYTCIFYAFTNTFLVVIGFYCFTGFVIFTFIYIYIYSNSYYDMVTTKTLVGHVKIYYL